MSEHELKRLRDEDGSLEQALLRSAAQDQPALDLQAQAMASVLLQQRRELERRARQRLLAAGAAVTLAAGFAVWWTSARPPTLVAESTPSARSEPVAPRPSTSSVPTSPLALCSPASVASGDQPLLDDFEDGDTRLLLSDKRAGSWVTYNDGTAPMLPRPGAAFSADRLPGRRGESKFGLHVTGGKFSKWGAVLGVELSPRRCYDASAYAGIEFWARGKARLRVAVRMTQIVSEEFGGSCVKDCFDSHGAERLVTKDWQRYEVRWDDLTQKGFGIAVPFDARSLFSIEFAVPEGRPAFDYWLDDVSFIVR